MIVAVIPPELQRNFSRPILRAIVPYIKYNEREIRPATSTDIEQIFSESDMLPGLTVAIDDSRFIQATVLTDSAMIIYCDEKTQVAKLAKTLDNKSVNRSESLEILKRFLDSEELHPEFKWTESEQIPYLKPRLGCASVFLALALFAIVLVAVSNR